MLRKSHQGLARRQKRFLMEASGRVLVVDDDNSMRHAIQRLLNASGLATAGYASAEELLAVGPDEADACVVSDLKLPGMSGLELLTELRVRGWQRPLILMTAHDSAGVRKDAERNGVACYLAKPFPGEALVVAIRTAMGSTKPGA
jgi:two-component system, LuxR family, response regulator FixJ